MKKTLWLVVSFVLLVLVIGIMFIATKPSDLDYANWMEDRYPLRCADKSCDVFEMKVSENGHEKILTMQSVQGNYSPGIFVMRKDIVYRDYENPSYQLDLEVKGYLGKINVMKEQKNIMKN